MKNKMRMYQVVVIVVLSVLSICCNNNTPRVQTYEKGSFTDSRDGRTYKTIRIGDQWIMAENLAYKPGQGNYWAYGNDSGNVAKYGYLYDWETAKKIAPPGWHLPTVTEWKTFRSALGGVWDVYKYMGGTMEKVYKQMVVGGNGFNALLSGIRTVDGRFLYLGERTDFWSSSISNEGQWFYLLDSKKGGKPSGLLDSDEGTAALASHQNDATGGKSVRLFKD